jgi:hypothetical protein
MTAKHDPLDEVFVKPEVVEGEQRALLAGLIFPFASINPDTGEVHLKETADDLTAKQRILVYLLCKLALSTRPNTSFAAATSPKEIEKALMSPGGTIRPKLLELLDERIIMRSKAGEGYFVHASSLRRAKALLLPE